MSLVFSKSLFVKQAILTLLLAISLSLISNSIQLLDGITQQKKMIENNFNQLLGVVEQPLASAVFRLDYPVAKQQVESLLNSPSIAKVEVSDENGKLFVAASAPQRVFSSSQALADWLFGDFTSFQRPLIPLIV